MPLLELCIKKEAWNSCKEHPPRFR